MQNDHKALHNNLKETQHDELDTYNNHRDTK